MHLNDRVKGTLVMVPVVALIALAVWLLGLL